MAEPSVTILIPNYKTPELTKICLRLLNKFTPAGKVRIIAIDNDSRDGSLDYLRSLPWIQLIERRDIGGENGPKMHAKALDAGLAQVTTEFVLVIHTDTFVMNGQWLDFLLSEIQKDPQIAGVGSWKLEYVSPLKRFAKKIEDFFRRLAGRNIRQEDQYLRSHCALYRTELIRKYTHGFDDNDTAGHSLHKILVQNGFKMVFLPSSELGKYIRHLNHATTILNPEGKNGRRTSKPKAGCRIRNAMDLFREVLESPELDQRKEL